MHQPKPHSKQVAKKIINSAINKWIDSITDKEVRKLARRDTIVTGGAIASLLTGEIVNDYDIYFKTKETTKAVALYYHKVFALNNPNGAVIQLIEQEIENIKGVTEKRLVNWIQSDGSAVDDSNANEEKAAIDTLINNTLNDMNLPLQEDELEDKDVVINPLKGIKDESENDDDYKPVYISGNAITLTNKIQIITRFYGEPDEIHGNYDFQHATNYYLHNGSKTKWDRCGELVLKQEALECLLSKQLVYCGSLYPVATLFRIRKFIKRGWSISAGEIVKIAFQISGINLNDLNVLREQLVGVDAYYMMELIARMEADKAELETAGKTFEIDSTYIMHVVNDVFGE